MSGRSDRKPRKKYKTKAEIASEPQTSPTVQKRFSLGGGKRCHRCEKLVGFAEEKPYEHGKQRLIFHSGCFNIWYVTVQKLCLTVGSRNYKKIKKSGVRRRRHHPQRLHRLRIPLPIRRITLPGSQILISALI